MDLQQLLQDLTPIFKNELNDKSIVLTPLISATDIENWDSLTNIQLIVSIEKHYKIRFTSKEIQGFQNVGELGACILSKIG